MKDLKWKTGPVPKDGTYLVPVHGVENGYTFVPLLKGYTALCGKWIAEGDLSSIPVEEPPLPPVTWYCHNSKRKFTEEDSRVHCMQNEHTVTLTQGDNTIILRGES